MVDINFANQLGWYAFISLLVLVLLYLIRPKPKDTSIPSLMFFIKTGGITKQNSFLRNFINNLLFFLQLLTLAGIAFALTAPYTTVPKESVEKDTVIVLDISASMQARQNGEVRFDKALSIAKDNAASSTSIVLASNIPIVVLEKGNKEKTLKILSTISPKDTTSNIGDAMLMAGSLLGNKGKVVVISDMKQTDGLDISAAYKALTAKGLEVELQNVGGKASNVGIIDLKITKHDIKSFVKNYNDAPKTITLTLGSETSKSQLSKTIPANSIEIYDFETPTGASRLQIEEKDDFDVDNMAYIIGPNTKKIKVLLVTNIDKSSVRTALLSSPDIELKIAEPPVTPSLDYDVIIMNGFSKDLLLPGFFEDLGNKIKKGGDAVIVAQDNLDKINFKLMPVKLGILINNQSGISTIIENQFTSGIDFGRTSKYFEAELQDGTAILAAGDYPIMAVRNEDSGSVIYYGIFDDESEFRNSVSYPIFWNKLVNYLYSTQDLAELNTKTDKILPLEKQKVDTPYGTIETNRLFFDKEGIYTINGKKIAASLLDEKESDVSSDISETIQTPESTKKGNEKERKSFVDIFALAALVFIMLELLAAKLRGDV